MGKDLHLKIIYKVWVLGSTASKKSVWLMALLFKKNVLVIFYNNQFYSRITSTEWEVGDAAVAE